ncbi:MAG: nucleoside-triphosphatase [Bacteroidales bacterium]
MITIITGDKNSGKSTYLKHWYLQDKIGSGVISEKTFLVNTHIGYDVVYLPGEEKIPLCRLSQYTEDLWGSELIQQGRYLFCSYTFKRVEEFLRKKLEEESVLWIDEVGFLELYGHGYAKIIDQAKKKNIQLRMTVRQSLLNKILYKFKLTDCRIITL